MLEENYRHGLKCVVFIITMKELWISYGFDIIQLFNCNFLSWYLTTFLNLQRLFLNPFQSHSPSFTYNTRHCFYSDIYKYIYLEMYGLHYLPSHTLFWLCKT